MFGLGPTELILIALALLLLFGGRKIPELMRGLGSGIREFKKAASVEEEEMRPSQEVADPKRLPTERSSSAQ
ncbi:MAG: twin-arginine translocase TatA/TatE family subunit [Candidatus Kapabacteria bacterium]|nr:twin-arginine translocase TatA/TatE family subunit [Candidatus Kapabacteria bacterium]MCS7169018.1 twin-arginine translocase TatA/TatE family subunit [Candidatus Kapabacteria bacterium]MDW7997121.1 twin-arginine translocase TatA/TatE family subunit [Bacteroidota bacterium]MDW8225764.1 twin-arginine translocase TatA/TatE family subunit [Bacteroidota bacterium]